jgi:hypothetical protein
MAYRYVGLAALGLAMVVSCAGDEDQKRVPAGDGGVGGEGAEPASGGTESHGGGAGGESIVTSGGSGAGGQPIASGGAAGERDVANRAGAGGEQLGGAAGGDAAGENQPVSACGEGSYEADEGCATCPVLAEPNDPIPLECGHFQSARVSAEFELVVTFTPEYPVHEGFAGMAHLRWVDAGSNEGEADVPWRYEAHRTFVFTLPAEARYAERFDFDPWVFTDACGFIFGAGAGLQVWWDGQESWTCGDPA